VKIPPRVPGLPLLGNAAALLRDPLGFLTRVSEEHGDVVEFSIPGQRIVLFNHPDAIDQMLVGEREHLIKDKLTRELSLMLGNGLLLSEGAFWRKQRKLAQPAFHRERVLAYGDVMVRYTERAVDAWSDGGVRDIHRDMMALTLDVVAKTLFDVEIAEVARKIEQSLDVLMQRFSGAGVLIPPSLPTLGNVRAKRAMRTLDDIVYGIIRERRRGGDSGDLLSMLIAATTDDEGAMDDVQLRDEAMTLLLAGHETTALTLSFAFHLLTQHPQASERLLQEIDRVLGDRPATSSDLGELRYADWIVRETLRLYPPAWAVGREVITPIEIGGYPLAVGTQLWAAQWVVQRDARWFPRPNEFEPERWDDDFARKLPRHAWFPFGGGPRVCIGNTFAMMEAVLILVTIARRFHFEPAPDAKPLELTPSVTLRPKHGVRLVCRMRRADASARSRTRAG
jgi:cytochrome P450